MQAPVATASTLRTTAVQKQLETEVHAEDRALVGNVIDVMQILRSHKFVQAVEISVNKNGYNVIGTLASGLDKEVVVLNSDFELLQSISPARINAIMLQLSGGALDLVVRVSSRDMPISFSEAQISHIRKRQRFW